MTERPAPTRWYWVRHAPVLGAESELYDTADEPADVSNTAAFRALATSLPKDARWITSNLMRAKQTADEIASAGNMPRMRHEDIRLAEQDFGDWFGQPISAIRQSLSDFQKHNFWMVDAATRPDNGESYLDLLSRVSTAVDEACHAFTGETIVAVAHGGVIRAALSYAMGIDPDRSMAISVENLSVTRLDYWPGAGRGGDWRLVFTNMRPV